MKKILALILALITIAALSACSAKPPVLDEVRDELVALVEGSYRINDIFFGEGLETYRRGGDYDKEHHIYSDDDYEFSAYEYVTSNSGYFFVETIKTDAEKIYTADYLQGIYTMAFDGYADENTGAVVTARYLDGEGWLMKYAYGDNDPFNILPGKRIYDFDTMQIVKPSTDKYLNVEISSHLEGESETLVVTLHFKLTENGWRLDGPTY